MKNLLKLFLLLGVLSSCDNSNFKIEGKIEGIKKGKVYLLKEDLSGNYINVDSSEINNSQDFVLKTNIESPELLLLKTSVKNSPSIQLFAEKGDLKFSANIDNLFEAKVEGSKNQEFLDEFNKMQKQFNIKGNEIYASAINVLKDNPKANLDSINLALTKNESRRKMYTINYAITHSNYDIAPFIAISYLSNEHITVLDTINNSLSQEVKKGLYAGELENYIANLKASDIGEKFPKLTSKNSEGETVEISNPGNYLLLNVYSAGVENKNEVDQALANLVDKFSNNELKVFSVSIDSSLETWKNSLNDVNSKFINLNDNLGRKSEVINKLAISTIPFNILVDKNGIIVARNADETQIEELIKENN